MGDIIMGKTRNHTIHFVFIVTCIIAPLFSITGMLARAEDKGIFAGGSGAEDDPYLIATAEHLNKIRDHKDKHFRQVADIDLSDYSEDDGWMPISDANKFTGSYDGNGHRIKNLKMNRLEVKGCGLFGAVDVNASISNVTLENVDITGKESVGGLVGYNYGTINKCFASGKVMGEKKIGGLIGYNLGTVNNCNTSGQVSGDRYQGGIVGTNIMGSINNCFSDASVTGGVHTGGIVGRNDKGNIIDCSATGIVTGFCDLGGLAGMNDGIISNSFARGDVTSRGLHGFSVAGLAGSNFGKITNSFATGNVNSLGEIKMAQSGGLIGTNTGDIDTCFATGNVDGGHSLGGLIGANRGGKINNSYSLGNVRSESSNTGGFIGINGGTITNSYSKGEVTQTSVFGNRIGGFVGHNQGIIASCYKTGDVHSQGKAGMGSFVGGFVGLNSGSISDSYSIGNVKGKIGVGGFVGCNVEWRYMTPAPTSGRPFAGSIRNCYASGMVEGDEKVGGLVGWNNIGHAEEIGVVLNSYYDKDSAELDDTEKGIPTSKDDMKRHNTFMDWDFDDRWLIKEKDGFPYLQWQEDIDNPHP